MLNPSPVLCAQLADQLERSYQGEAWHGPSLLEAVAGVDAVLAGRRPLPEVHTLAETVGHVAFWIRDTAQRLQGLPALDRGEDWPAAAWPEALADLASAQGALRAALRTFDDDRLGAKVQGQELTCQDLLLGLLQHNAYHAGQLATLRRASVQAGGAP